MTLENKQDLDALLRRWPALAPGKPKGVIEHEDNADWEGRADAIVGAALAAGAGDASAFDALDAPPLPILAGEPDEAFVGEKKMSQENEPGGSPTSGESSTVSPTSAPPPERKRTSLRAIAEKANQSGPRSSVAPSSSARASTSTPIPSAPAAASSRPATSTPIPRPKEAGADDSGMINLNVVQASATPQQIADAEKAKPASAGLFDDDKPAVAAAAAANANARPANVIPIAGAKEAKRSNGPIVGFVIAAIGVAAAVAIMKMQKPHEAPIAATQQKAAVTAEAKQVPAVATAAPTAAAVAAADPSAAPSAEPDKGGDAPKVVGGPLPNSGGASAAGTVAAKDAPPDDSKVAAADKPTGPTRKPGDLQSEMARAVGADGKPIEAAGGTPEPAAGNPKTQNIPEQPSQGAAQSAVGSVIGGAKACVAGADDVSRANVTFGSNGSVSSVSVTGWAAAHGKTACVTSALKGAKVGPFSRPTYVIPVTLRP